MISPDYLKQQRELHADIQYGTSGYKYAALIKDVAGIMGTQDILDYGCGKRTMETALGFPIKNYDPSIPGLDESPQPADLVVCTDVLEHIEPDYLDNVLDDLERVTKSFLVAVVVNRPAKKVLADGRNAHLIQEPMSFWVPRFEARFHIREIKTQGSKMFFFLGAR